jgi:hypothetical protein
MVLSAQCVALAHASPAPRARPSCAQHVHWVLAVIDVRQHEVRYYDSLGGVDQTCIVRPPAPAAFLFPPTPRGSVR